MINFMTAHLKISRNPSKSTEMPISEFKIKMSPCTWAKRRSEMGQKGGIRVHIELSMRPRNRLSAWSERRMIGFCQISKFSPNQAKKCKIRHFWISAETRMQKTLRWVLLNICFFWVVKEMRRWKSLTPTASWEARWAPCQEDCTAPRGTVMPFSVSNLAKISLFQRNSNAVLVEMGFWTSKINQ